MRGRLSLLAPLLMAAVFSWWYTSSQSIRLDESQSLWVATKTVPAILQLTATDVHVPLYSMLLHFWLQIGGNSIVVARLLSVVFFLLTIPALYAMAKKVTSPQVALTTVTLFCLSPFVLWYANEARMYTLFALVTTLNQHYFLTMVDSVGKRGKLEWWLTAVIGFYTHYFFVLLIFTEVLYLVWRFLGREMASTKKRNFEKVRHESEMGLIWFGWLIVTAGIFFLPWIVYFATQGGGSKTSPLLPPPTSYSVMEVFVNFVFGFSSQYFQGMVVSLWPLLLGVMFFVFAGRRTIKLRHGRYFFLTVLLSLILVFTASMVRPLFLSRYLIFVIPSTFLLIATILHSISAKKRGYVIGATFVMMVIMAYFQNSSQLTSVREDYRGVDAYLSSEVTGRDLIVVSAPFTIYPIEYNYLGPARIVTIPEWNRFAEAMPAYDGAKMEAQLKSYEGVYERLFLVLSYDQGYEEEIVHYFDGHYQRLGMSEFPPSIRVMIYQFAY